MSKEQKFEASPEARSKSTKLRIFSWVAWIAAIAGQVYAIFNLISDDMMMWLSGAIVVILILAMTGSYLWKKANRLDPASEKDTSRFFVQNQLGACWYHFFRYRCCKLVLQVSRWPQTSRSRAISSQYSQQFILNRSFIFFTCSLNLELVCVYDFV